MDLLTDAVTIDETLMKAGVTEKFIISELVMGSRNENLEDAGNIMLAMSKAVVATCFPTNKYSWWIFQASGLPQRMGYYFQDNRSPPSLVASSSREAQPVRCVETGEKYPSAGDVAFASDVPVRSVYAHLAGDYSYPTVKGYSYVWDNGDAKVAPQQLRVRASVARPVKCVETGDRYASASEAAVILKCNLNSIYAHLRGDIRYRTVKGKTFEYD